MEKKYKILLICFLPIALFSQTYYFNNQYQSVSNSGSSVHAIIETENGYLVGGGTGTPPDDYWIQITLMVLDNEGNKLDEILIGDTSSQYFISKNSFIRTLDNLLTFTGSRLTSFSDFPHDEVLLVKLNDEFDTLWSKLYGEKELPYDSAYIARHLIETPDSNLVIIGTMTPEINYNDNIVLIKTDKDGNKLSEWLYTYPNTNYKLRGFSVIATPDKGFAIGAYRFKPGFSYTGEPMVYKVDSLGNEEWHLDVGGPYFDTKTLLCNAHDGNIIAVSCYADSMSGSDNAYRRIKIIKLDIEGNIVWNKKYAQSMLYYNIGNIQQTTDGGYIATGTNATAQFGYPYPYFSSWLFKIDGEGDSLWHRYKHNLPGSDDYNYLYDIIQTSDNGYAACGEVFGDETGYTQHAWVLKVDSMGCDTPGCFTTVIGEEYLVNSEGELRVWPNPAHNVVTLSLSKCEPIAGKTIYVRIYNSQGIKVDEIKVPSGIERIEVDVSNYTNGLYYLQYVNSGQVVETAKFIKN